MSDIGYIRIRYIRGLLWTLITGSLCGCVRESEMNNVHDTNDDVTAEKCNDLMNDETPPNNEPTDIAKLSIRDFKRES